MYEFCQHVICSILDKHERFSSYDIGIYTIGRVTPSMNTILLQETRWFEIGMRSDKLPRKSKIKIILCFLLCWFNIRWSTVCFFFFFWDKLIISYQEQFEIDAKPEPVVAIGVKQVINNRMSTAYNGASLQAIVQATAMREYRLLIQLIA